MGEVEALLSRSGRFMGLDSICVEKGMYDLACSNAQQAAQLLLKALTLKRLGYIPRTHSIRELIGGLTERLGGEELEEYVKARRLDLTVLEDAYTSSRYFIKEFTEDDSGDCIPYLEPLAPQHL